MLDSSEYIKRRGNWFDLDTFRYEILSFLSKNRQENYKSSQMNLMITIVMLNIWTHSLFIHSPLS